VRYLIQPKFSLPPRDYLWYSRWRKSHFAQFLSECVLFPPVSVIPPILHTLLHLAASFSRKNRPSLSAFEKQCFFRNHRAMNGGRFLPFSLYLIHSPRIYLLSNLGVPEGRSALLGYCQSLKYLYQFQCHEHLHSLCSPTLLFLWYSPLSPRSQISLVIYSKPLSDK